MIKSGIIAFAFVLIGIEAQAARQAYMEVEHFKVENENCSAEIEITWEERYMTVGERTYICNDPKGDKTRRIKVPAVTYERGANGSVYLKGRKMNGVASPGFIKFNGSSGGISVVMIHGYSSQFQDGYTGRDVDFRFIGSRIEEEKGSEPGPKAIAPAVQGVQ